MAEVMGEIENPLSYEVAIECPNCGNIIKIDINWGTSAAMELALQPISCEKCGVRVDGVKINRLR